MATLTKIIKPSGGDYASPTLFEAAIPNDATDKWIGSEQSGSSYANNRFQWNVTDANNMQHELVVDPAYDHGGDKTTGAYMGDSNGWALMEILTPCILRGWRIGQINNATQVLISATAAAGTIIEGCLFYRDWNFTSAHIAISAAVNGVTIRSNHFTTTKAITYGVYTSANATVTVVNNTFCVATSGSYNHAVYLFSAGGTVTVKNNIFGGSYVTRPANAGSGTMNKASNLTPDGTDGGTGGWSMSALSLADSDIFADAPNGDLRLKTTFKGYLYQGDAAAAGSTDILGFTWPSSGVNAGAEYDAAPPAGGTVPDGLSLGLTLGL